MGTFRVEIVAVGGHGCSRKEGDGEALAPRCHNEFCPDCRVRDLVEKFRGAGMLSHNGSKATLQHWPGQPSEVVDDLLTNTRHGRF